MPEVTMVNAINKALDEEMTRDDRVMVLGEDVAVDGGIFRVTDGLLAKHGEDRVVDTPLAEAGIIGVSVGLAVGGMRPVPEMQFQAFSYYAFHQLEHHVARYRKRSNGRFTCPVVVRMPYGAGIHALELHSESREAYFAHTPGLKVVIPSGPLKAWAFLKAAIRDPDPVVFCEPSALYRKYREDVPADGDAPLPPLGEADVVREGDDVTLVAYGAMLHVAAAAAEALADEDDVHADVIDLQTVSPLDTRTVVGSVKKTGRAVVVHEAPRTLGLAAEVIARVNEDALDHLEAPIARVTGPDVPVPLFARERDYMPDAARVVDAARETMRY